MKNLEQEATMMKIKLNGYEEGEIRVMTREEAYKILEKNMTKPNLIKHCLAVESVMRHFAEMNNEDVEYWGNVGLLHDIDYELYPEEHCKKYREVLKDAVDDDFIRVLESHGHELCTDVRPEKFMEKILVTIDQLTGFITACALMKPSKKLEDVELASMHKKWKNKSFAARDTKRKNRILDK